MLRIRLVGTFGHYRSGTREALIAVSLEDDLEKLADATVADWPDIAFAGQFERAIGDLYRLHLRFPPAWSQEDCDDFIAENVDMAATRLTTELDDLIDTVVDGYERQHGIRPHNDDARDMIDAARRSAIYELNFDIEALSEELATNQYSQSRSCRRQYDRLQSRQPAIAVSEQTTPIPVVDPGLHSGYGGDTAVVTSISWSAIHWLSLGLSVYGGEQTGIDRQFGVPLAYRDDAGNAGLRADQAKVDTAVAAVLRGVGQCGEGAQSEKARRVDVDDQRARRGGGMRYGGEQTPPGGDVADVDVPAHVQHGYWAAELHIDPQAAGSFERSSEAFV